MRYVPLCGIQEGLMLASIPADLTFRFHDVVVSFDSLGKVISHWLAMSMACLSGGNIPVVGSCWSFVSVSLR